MGSPAYQFQNSNNGIRDLETLVRTLTFQQATDQGLFSQPQLDELLNSAHRAIFSKIVSTDPTWFSQRSTDQLIQAAGLYIGGTSLDPNTVLDVLMVELKDSQGNYRQLLPIAYQEKDRWEGTSWRVDGAWAVYRWTQNNQTIILYPNPSTQQTLRITYTPACPTLVNPTDQPFAIGTGSPAVGTLAQFHEMVGWLAASMAKERDESAAWILSRYNKMERDLVDHVKKRQSQRPRHILETEVFDW